MQAVLDWAEAARDPQDGGYGDATATALGQAVEELLDQETTYAEQNGKRLNLVRQAFSQSNFEATVNIVDRLLSPVDVVVNKFLRRSTVLKSMRFKDFGTDAGTTLDDLQQYSKQVFLIWASGQLGLTVVGDFMSQLRSPDLAKVCQSVNEQDAELPRTCFQLILFGASDCWRRMCFSVRGFPFAMFSLVDLDVPEFIEKWTAFRQSLHRCHGCVDAGFTKPLLETVDFSALDEAASVSQVRDLQQFLASVASFCPLGTDSVENVHGQQQSMLHCFRGKSKGEGAAAEVSVLSSLKTEHAFLTSIVQNKSLPTRRVVAQMVRNLGRKKGLMLHKKQSLRIRKAASKQPRPICGWNVYQREHFRKLKSKVTPSEYKATMKQLSHQWRHLPPSERRNFKLKASYEQSQREELQSRPLSHGRSREQADPTGDNQETTSNLEQIAGQVLSSISSFSGSQPESKSQTTEGVA